MTRQVRSLRNSVAFQRFVLDQLASLDVRAKSMFGGTGLYSRDDFFGIIARDVLYLRVDDENRARYEAAGMKGFKPYLSRPSTMQYREVPLEVLESSAELEAWAKESIRAAQRAAKS